MSAAGLTKRRGRSAVQVLAASALAMAASSALAVDTSAWVCEFCPFEQGTDGHIVAGVSTVSDDSAYFGNATGYDDSGAYADLDAVGAYVGENQQLRWQAYDLGLDSRSARLTGGNQGVYEYDLAYWSIPRDEYFTTETIFAQSGTTLSLPPGWVRAPITSGFTQLGTDLAGRDIDSKRSVWEVGGSYLPASRFEISANFQQQKNDGLGIYGGSFFTQASLLPGPFDYQTNLVDLGVRYTLGNGHVSLDYFLSDFDNSESEIRWENPFTSAPGAEFGALSQAPDNKFHQVSLSGSYAFPEHRTVATFLLASGRMTQDQAFLPYTTNPNLVVSPLPSSNLDGKVDTTDFAFSLTSRAFDKTVLNLDYRYDNRDNKTPQQVWMPVIADTFVSGATEVNTPYSFKRYDVELSGDYELTETVRISAGYDWKKLDRTFQEVDSQTDEGGWGGIRWQPNNVLQLDLRGGATERDPDNYDTTVGDLAGQNPMMRLYNMAYRYRRYAELTTSVTLPEKPVSIGFNALWADDDYSQTQLGITKGEDFRFAGDVNWIISDGASIYVTGGYEKMEIDQSGSENFSTADWFATNKDEFYTYGAGLRFADIMSNLDLQFDYTRTDGTTKINLTSLAGGDSQFPNLNSTLNYWRLNLEYQRSEKLQYALNARYQTISSSDWALDGVGPATIPVVLTLGADAYDNHVWIFGLNVRYSLGKSSD